ncbi:hypothetical protein MIND_00403500 [Mycena indigotica]|uniref:DUF6534 domain-containing protein n=1 Tax=Mycena indigotica TaxID=2126181 RepID=A0A8H6T1H7_9AGAR|nr:uncharacterized protein MIND_00403500 [Mycena indigotica]KAF7310295.1 hypothetical protein MIND_00403500 [Mycena indigotica]
MSAEAFDPNPTLGALLVGTLAGAVTTVQAYIYHTRFPDDHWMIKATVAFIWAAEASHVGAVSHTLYTLLVTDYGHPEALLARPPRSIIGYIFITVTVAVTVQIFFSYRIYVLSKSRIIPYITYALSFVRFVLGVSLFSVGLSVKSVTEFGTKWQWLGVTMWSLSAAEDVTITATLVFLLWRQRGKVHKSTTAFLDKIIMWAIETGLMTCSLSLITVILFHRRPNDFIWIAFSTIEARMFSNSLLASLNSRHVLRELREGGSKNGGVLSLTNTNYMRPTYAPGPPTISVEVHTTHDVERDLDSDSSMRKGSAY